MQNKIQEESVRECQGQRRGCKLGQLYLSRDLKSETEQKKCLSAKVLRQEHSGEYKEWLGGKASVDKLKGHSLNLL